MIRDSDGERTLEEQSVENREAKEKEEEMKEHGLAQAVWEKRKDQMQKTEDEIMKEMRRA
jgi:hypothetical protein